MERRAAGAARAVSEAVDFACLAARAASAKQGEEVLVLDVRELITITDYFVIPSGASDRQVKTISEAVGRAFRGEGPKPVRPRGQGGPRGILLDFAACV